MKTTFEQIQPEALGLLINLCEQVITKYTYIEISEYLEGVLGDNIPDQDKLNWIYKISQDLKEGRLPE